MLKKTWVFLILAFFCAVAVTGCSKKDKKLYDKNLSDLGGVFTADLSDIDFSYEISGNLLDEELLSDPTESEAFSYDISVSGQYSDKLLSWGIRRKPDHGIPDADPGAPELLSRYGGVYLGDTGKKVVYLTFDEGYENGYTPKILDVLKKHNVKAVFFITGPYLKEHSDLVERMVNEGHEVGNHTIHHLSLPQLSDAEIEEEVVGLDRAFYKQFGKNMKFLRPPKGEYSERSLAVTQRLGYCNMFWSFAYDDWYRDKIRGANYAVDIVTRNLHNGAIILLHAVSKDNADALETIIMKTREMGYEFGDVNDLLKPANINNQQR